MSHKKFGPDRFSRFDDYWIQTNKQTDKHPDRQAKFIYRFRTKPQGGGETPPLTVIGLIKIVFLSKIIMIC